MLFNKKETKCCASQKPSAQKYCPRSNKLHRCGQKKSYSYANILPTRFSQTVKLRVLNLSACTTLCRAFCFMGFPGGSDSKCGKPRFDLWVNNIPCRMKCQPTPEFLPGKSHGQRRLADYSSWGRKKSDATERLTHLLWFQNLDCPSMPAVSA